jgi:hypothetical protein
MSFKGQYFSFDAIVASVIFLLAVVALLSYWYSIKTYLDFQSEDLSKEAIRVSNLLFSPPSPSSDCATVDRLGFSMSFDDRRSDSSMIECAKTNSRRNASWFKEKLAMAAPYDVFVRISPVSDEVSIPQTLVGVEPSPDAKEVVKLRRTSTIYNSSSRISYLAVFDIFIYKQ